MRLRTLFLVLPTLLAAAAVTIALSAAGDLLRHSTSKEVVDIIHARSLLVVVVGRLSSSSLQHN